MLKETIARRYSAALFSLAKGNGAVDAAVADLDAFVQALASDPSIREFYESPVIDRTEKIGVLERACRDKMSELALAFVTLLVRKRRENLIATIARQMHDLVDEDKGTISAVIATPTPLGDADVAQLARRLSNVYRRQVVPEPKVDPELLGGAVVQVGDRYVDASVAGKLESIRRHLLESVDAPGTTSPNGKGS